MRDNQWQCKVSGCLGFCKSSDSFQTTSRPTWNEIISESGEMKHYYMRLYNKVWLYVCIVCNEALNFFESYPST